MADADSTLRLSIQVDGVGNVEAAMKTASGAVQSETAKMAASFMAQGLTAKEAQSALLNLGISAEGVKSALAELGINLDLGKEKTLSAATAMGGLERAAAGAGGRLIGMSAGLGMAGGALGRVASYLPGIGQAFVVALPIALIADAVEQIEKFREGVEKASRQSEELAIESYKVADSVQLENLKLEDQIQKLELRPTRNTLKEALLEDKAAAEGLTKGLQESIQKANDLLTVGVFSQFFTAASGNEAQIKDKLQPIINAIQAARLKLAEAPPGSKAATDAINEQIEAYAKLKQTAQFAEVGFEAAGGKMVTDSKGVTTEIFKESDSIAKMVELEIQATNATAALNAMKEQGNLRTEVAQLEQKKELNDFWKTYSVGFAQAERELARHDEMWKKFWAEQRSEVEKTQNELSKIDEEGAKDRAEIEARIGARITETNIANAKIEAQQVEDALRSMATERQKALSEGSGSKSSVEFKLDTTQLQTLDSLIVNVSREITTLKNDIAALESQPFISEADQANLQKYNQELGQQQLLLDRLRQEHQQISDRIEKMWTQISEKMANAFNGAVNQVLLGHEKIGQAALRLGGQLELYLIDKGIKNVVTNYGESFLKMLSSHTQFITQFIASHSSFLATLLGIQTTGATTQIAQAKVAELGQVTADAGVAGAAGFASVMEALPFPANISTAPAIAATAAAQTLSYAAFQEGGIVPKTGFAMIHQQEMVLPKNISTFIQSAAAGASGATGAAGLPGLPGAPGAAGGPGAPGLPAGTANESRTVHQHNRIEFHQHTGAIDEEQIGRIVKKLFRRGAFA